MQERRQETAVEAVAEDETFGPMPLAKIEVSVLVLRIHTDKLKDKLQHLIGKETQTHSDFWSGIAYLYGFDSAACITR